jgi:hypothetical protein
MEEKRLQTVARGAPVFEAKNPFKLTLTFVASAGEQTYDDTKNPAFHGWQYNLRLGRSQDVRRKINSHRPPENNPKK